MSCKPIIVCILSLLYYGYTHCTPQTSSTISNGQELTQLEAVLNGDGTVNLSNGSNGRYDVRGWKMITDPGGKPRFVRLRNESIRSYSNFTTGNNPDDSLWDARFVTAGMNDEVRALAIIGTDLYVGGNFTSAGNVSANHIAKWDGIRWSSLDSGVDDAVCALAVIGTDLYAGGYFSMAG